MSIERSAFGKTGNGADIDMFTCINEHGLSLKLITYGAIVVSLETPDRDGKLANINVGFDSLAPYLERHPYFGSTVGRYCNRIARGKFELDGQSYNLATNNPPNHLHGGDKGFDQAVWTAAPIDQEGTVGVRFEHTSEDGDEGFPGNLKVVATYTLNDQNELSIQFEASTDKATPVNLTNHNYWNLAGVGAGAVYDHELTLSADQYLAVDETLIPTGEYLEVAGTPFDFRSQKPLGRDLNEIDADPVGYDHCYVIRPQDDVELAHAATVFEPRSGRRMVVSTTQPGVQLYTGNFLDGSPSNGGNKKHEAFCLETQHFPDSPNQAKFPSTVLQPGETFQQRTVHRFSAK